jgi:RNA polymerase sigma-70 factor (ECF subfamily)
MAAAAELAQIFQAESPAGGGALPSTLGARLVELCTEASEVTKAFGMTDADLVRALAARARGDASYLDKCQAADLTIVLACARGSADAIAMLERKHHATLAFTCRRFANAGHTTEDLMQILREKLFVTEGDAAPKIADYDGRGSFATWLRVTAVRLFIDLTRRKDRAREAVLADEEPDLIAPADIALDTIKAEYREAVAAALAEAAMRLESGDRHILRQHLVAGLSIDQLGAAMGVHRATAARRISRARELLATTTRDLLAERLSLEPEELGEVYGLVISKLDMSIARLLATGRPTA